LETARFLQLSPSVLKLKCIQTQVQQGQYIPIHTKASWGTIPAQQE